jgi:Icc-related predicted phosphoesterase
MKFVAISDSHTKHHRLLLPSADAIIHAGDISSRGFEGEIIDFLDWFRKLDYKYKIFIAGNHDFYFEKQDERKIKQLIPSNVIYLNDSGIQIEGIKIWGSPIQPWFYNWAFNRYRGADIKKHWDLIPTDTDILITHGPVEGILDKTINGDVVGCKDLLEKVQEIKPKFHICGHIHEGYGIMQKDETTFINASVLDENYRLKNEPIVFDL